MCSRRYPNHATFSPALNSLITTLAASLFSPFADLSPFDAILARATSNAFPLFPFSSLSCALTGSFTYHGFHAGSHPESGYDSVVRPALFLSRSLSFLFALSFDRSLCWCLHIPFDSLPRTLPPYRRLYIVRKFRTPQTRGSSRISRVRISLSPLLYSLAASLRSL